MQANRNFQTKNDMLFNDPCSLQLDVVIFVEKNRALNNTNS